MSSISKEERELNELLAKYADKFSGAGAEDIIQDLLIFCYQTEDAVVRAGRYDTLFAILRKRHRGKDLARGKVIQGRASTSGTPRSAEPESEPEE